MVYFKFKRPDDPQFFNNRKNAPFREMLVPPAGHPTEKYCYAEIPLSLFDAFLKEYGVEGEILEDREEFPGSIFTESKRRRAYSILRPR